jgi:hypothetical protein
MIRAPDANFVIDSIFQTPISASDLHRYARRTLYLMLRLGNCMPESAALPRAISFASCRVRTRQTGVRLLRQQRA